MSVNPPIPLYHVWEYTERDREFWQEHLADWLPATIFDAHVHVNDPVHRIEEMTDLKRRQYWVNEVFEPISVEETDHCIATVFPDRKVSCLCFGIPSLEFDIELSNERLATDVVARNWKALVVTRPQWSAERLYEELKREGVVGAKPYYAIISHDPSSRDKHLESSIFDFLPHHQLEVLNAHRSWVTLHVPRAGRLADPHNIADVREIRERYPAITLVIAHLGRSYTLPHAQEALPHFAKDPGLLFDTSAVLNPEVLRFALETIGPERIVYGTDNPIFYMRGRRTWAGRTYHNHTSYPFFFNRVREPPEIESRYTLYMYEALKAFKDACQQLSLDRRQINNVFFDNAQSLIDAAVISRPTDSQGSTCQP